MIIRPMQAADWDAVALIYGEGIATGNATFESEVPAWETWDSSHFEAGRLVAEDEGGVIGWGALSGVSDRCVYGGVAEVSVYVAERARGRGVGTSLLDALVGASETAGIWTLQAGVFPENEASVALLRRGGFREVGLREHLGRLNGSWRDVLLLERRSRRVGIGAVAESSNGR